MDQLYDSSAFSPPHPPTTEAKASETPGLGVKDVVVKGFYSFLSCIFETSKKESECEIVFDDIKQIKFLGSGSHGTVFLGEYQSRTVAVKKLKELNMTLREMRHLRDLKHENIIGFLGVCIRPPDYGIVMEYCPRSLLEVLRERPIPPELVLDWATQIARGMHYLHGRHFIHRDLKSPNILITPLDVLKISDFGTCREFNGNSTKLSFVGTASWMAPEIIRNELCSEKCDVWAFGVVLWELLTGEMPYRGVEEAAIIYGVGSNRLHLPVPGGVPDGFSLLLKQCFNFTPKHRPQFRQILMHLEILAADTAFISTPHKTYFASQQQWGQEIARHFEELKHAKIVVADQESELLRERDEELREAQRVRSAYEAGLQQTTAMLQELSLLRDKLLNRSRSSPVRPGRAVVAGRARKIVHKKRPSFGKSASSCSSASDGLRARTASTDTSYTQESGDDSGDEHDDDQGRAPKCSHDA